MTYPDNTNEQYTYDGDGHMLTMQDRRGHTAITNQYDANGRVTQQTYADNTRYQFAYTLDNSGNAASSANAIRNAKGLDRITSAVTPQASIGYTHDAAGRRTSMTAAAQAIVNYYYYNANRLTSLTQSSGTDLIPLSRWEIKRVG